LRYHLHRRLRKQGKRCTATGESIGRGAFCMKGWSKKSEAVWNGISIVLRVVRKRWVDVEGSVEILDLVLKIC